MNVKNILYLICSILVIAGAVMKIYHMPYGNLVMISGMSATILILGWDILKINKRIEKS